MRGEYNYCLCVVAARGSSPLARGIPKPGEEADMQFRIIPACAGNTAVENSFSTKYEDHPRLRGEYVGTSL